MLTLKLLKMWKNKHALVSAKKPKHKNKDSSSGVKGPSVSSRDEAGM